MLDSTSNDGALPGRSLLALAREDDHARTAFSEYHAIFSRRGIFMLRTGRWKYVHYVADPPELYDLVADPDELTDLGADPRYVDVRETCEKKLRELVDPETVDARARAD